MLQSSEGTKRPQVQAAKAKQVPRVGACGSSTNGLTERSPFYARNPERRGKRSRAHHQDLLSEKQVRRHVLDLSGKGAARSRGKDQSLGRCRRNLYTN